MKDHHVTKKSIEVSPGESVRILRELQELSQNELSDLTGIPQAMISAIENDRVRLGVERAKVLARALKCHPAVLVFPGWDVRGESAAYRSLKSRQPYRPSEPCYQIFLGRMSPNGARIGVFG